MTVAVVVLAALKIWGNSDRTDFLSLLNSCMIPIGEPFNKVSYTYNLKCLLWYHIELHIRTADVKWTIQQRLQHRHRASCLLTVPPTCTLGLFFCAALRVSHRRTATTARPRSTANAGGGVIQRRRQDKRGKNEERRPRRLGPPPPPPPAVAPPPTVADPPPSSLSPLPPEDAMS
jgi:hypothetical protein